MHWRYPYHDRWKQQILQSDLANQQHSIDQLNIDTEIQLDKLSFMDESIPELILKGRFHRIATLAREFACCTTSNLTIELKHNCHLTLCIDGDFLIIHDREPLYALVKLLSRCDSFQVIPNGRLFQLLFHYDLQLME